jgi:hypothetical protein
MASFEERVGVQSFARQDPAFFGEPRDPNWKLTALRRATWTLVHEIGHGLGLGHYDHGTMRRELERDGRMCLDLETLSEFRRINGGDKFQEVCVET